MNFKRISLALVVMLMPATVLAAGLGKLNVQSAIGEPLKAEIELISASQEELASFTAVIASEEAYAEQGLERPPSHSGIKIEVVKNAVGSSILRLKSSQAISDPFLDMLIQLDWNSGRLLREYTVLLDPPGYKAEAFSQANSDTKRLPTTSAPAGSFPIGSASSMANETARTGKFKKMKKAARGLKSRASELALETDNQGVEADSLAGEHTTKKGDTLYKVAQEMRPEGVSLDQMLAGLFEANKTAFVGNNMNRLKVGQILKPPSEEALAAISRKRASQEVKAHTADWNAYRNGLAGAVAKTTPNETVVDSQPAKGKIKMATEDQSMPPVNGAKDVVKLSAGVPANGKADVVSEAKITALQEEATARTKGLQETQDRNAALEKQVADMKKLLDMKNNSLAEVQKQAQEQLPNPTAEATKPAIEPTKPIEPAKVEPTKPEATTKASNATPPAEHKPVVKPPVPPAAPVEQPSFLSSLIDSLGLVMLTILGGGVGVAALFYLRDKRKKNLESFEQGIMTSGGLKVNTVFGNTSSSTSVNTGDTSFLTDFTQSVNSGMIDTNDVDPIAEAEVYMAYGRDAQAEEILKDAIVKEPKRYELHLKLLEIYAASKNMSAFDAFSSELYTTLGQDSPVWAKVAEIGIKLEPNNPLYQVTIAPMDEDKGTAIGKLDAFDFADSRLAAASDLNFSMTEPAVSPVVAMAAATVPNSTGSFAIDIDNEPETSPFEFDMSEMVTESLNADTPQSFPSFDFDMTDQTTIEPTVTMEPVKMEPSVTMEIPTTSTPAGDDFNFDINVNLLGADDDKMEELPSLNFDGLESGLGVKEVKSAQTVVMEVKPAFENTITNETVNLAEAVTQIRPGMESFSLDVPTTIPPQGSKPAEEANAIDFSGISLDLEASDIAEPSFGEPAEVEIKLELVTAYIDMDDKEGAKELLEEVLKEGGTHQRERAEALLNKLA